MSLLPLPLSMSLSLLTSGFPGRPYVCVSISLMGEKEGKGSGPASAEKQPPSFKIVEEKREYELLDWM